MAKSYHDPTHSTCIVLNMVAFSKIWCGKAMCCHSDNKFNNILYETIPLIWNINEGLWHCEIQSRKYHLQNIVNGCPQTCPREEKVEYDYFAFALYDIEGYDSCWLLGRWQSCSSGKEVKRKEKEEGGTEHQPFKEFGFSERASW